MANSKHNISRAGNIFMGDGGPWSIGVGVWERSGVTVTPPFRWAFGNRTAPYGEVAPAAASATAIRTASAIGGAGAVTLNGALVSSGTATLDVARVITFTSVGDDSGITFTITATDWYGVTYNERVTGANAGVATALRAAKTVTGIVASGASAGNVSIGSGTALGLPFAVKGKWDILSFSTDATEELATSTFVPAVTTSPATIITGDPRGTIIPATASNGARIHRIWFTPLGTDTKAQLYGVDQFVS